MGSSGGVLPFAGAAIHLVPSGQLYAPQCRAPTRIGQGIRSVPFIPTSNQLLFLNHNRPDCLHHEELSPVSVPVCELHPTSTV